MLAPGNVASSPCSLCSAPAESAPACARLVRGCAWPRALGCPLLRGAVSVWRATAGGAPQGAPAPVAVDHESAAEWISLIPPPPSIGARGSGKDLPTGRRLIQPRIGWGFTRQEAE